MKLEVITTKDSDLELNDATLRTELKTLSTTHFETETELLADLRKTRRDNLMPSDQSLGNFRKSLQVFVMSQK